MNGESFVCNICENTLQKTEFPKDRTRSFGIKKTCKNCLANLRHNRKKTLSEEELIALADKKRKYNQRYYAENKNHIQKKVGDYKSHGHGLFLSITRKGGKRRQNYEFNETEFLEWYDSQDKVCHYYTMDLKTVNCFLRATNINREMKRFEIDRLNPELGYVVSNMVLACTVCNFHKKEFFNASDFRKIAIEYIKPKIEKFIP